MTPAEILKNIQAAGVAVALHDGVLRCRPKPTGELLNMIREHKADIIAELAGLPDLIRRAGEVSEHDAALRKELYRLFDRADELDQAGDTPGMLRILNDIRRVIQNASTATTAAKTPRNSTARVDEVAAATASPRPSNEEHGDIPGKPDPVLFPGSVPAITPPFDHADVVSERVAILEHDAGMNRATAEQEAARAVGPCYSCGGGRFWVSRWGVIVCERCHPPADTRLIERTIVLSDDNGKRAHA